MNVIKPKTFETLVTSIGYGKCFLYREVVHMRLSGIICNENEVVSAVLATGAAVHMLKTTRVIPVEMTAVEANA